MASKNLLTKTSKKKPRSQSKKATINTEYLYEIGDVLVYLGSVIESQNKQECKVVSRSRTRIQCFYKVEFADGDIIECAPDVLVYVGDFEAESESQDSQKDIPEIELEMIKNGIESHKNYSACLSPLDYYMRTCTSGCTYSSKCVYHKKGIYIKLD
ncbi:MAG TPA: hypothetical protein VIK72_16990 [Clostridiaceae bacterium]